MAWLSFDRARRLMRRRQRFDVPLTSRRAKGAKSLELRAAMSMARLWRDQGKRDEACELFAPVYGWFTEGFDTWLRSVAFDLACVKTQKIEK